MSTHRIRITNLHYSDAVIDRISLDHLEAGAVDHFDDLVLGHFYFAAGFDEIALAEFCRCRVA